MDLSDVSDVKAVPPQVPQTNQPHKKRLLSLPHKSIEPQYIPQHDLMGVAERQLIPMTNLYEVNIVIFFIVNQFFWLNFSIPKSSVLNVSKYTVPYAQLIPFDLIVD